jgi:hypothetical protein
LARCSPLLVGLLPALGLTILADRDAERWACGTMLLLATACVWHGCRVHRRWSLLALLGAGVALVTFAQWTVPPDCCAAERENWTEAAVMFAGGSLIAASHWLNRRWRRCACHPCADAAR